jgi:hypothetical protein
MTPVVDSASSPGSPKWVLKPQVKMQDASVKRAASSLYVARNSIKSPLFPDVVDFAQMLANRCALEFGRRPGPDDLCAVASLGLSFIATRRSYSEKPKGSFCHTLKKNVSFVGENLSLRRRLG